jgi:hypothetical protein
MILGKIKDVNYGSSSIQCKVKSSLLECLALPKPFDTKHFPVKSVCIQHSFEVLFIKSIKNKNEFYQTSIKLPDSTQHITLLIWKADYEI